MEHPTLYHTPPSAIKGNRGPVRGPCEVCGMLYRSYGAKRFCSMTCYQKSDVWKANREKMVKRNADRAASAMDRFDQCLECAKPNTTARQRRRKFCSQVCYRKYMADRFDRFIANPESLALPNNYDEFLSQGELTCLVDGCGWVGENLSCHMNFAHGIPAKLAKQLGGFNLSTGLVTPRVSKIFSDRQAITLKNHPDIMGFNGHTPKRNDSYRSLEAREHWKKATACNDLSIGGKAFGAKLRSDAAFRAAFVEKCRKRNADMAAKSQRCDCGAEWKGVRPKSGKCAACVRAAMLERNRTEPWKPIPCHKCGSIFIGTRNEVRNSRQGIYKAKCPACRSEHP